MDTFLWIVTALLALAFLIAGVTKLARSKPQLAESGMAWVEDFSPGVIKLIAALVLLALAALVAWGRFGPYPLGG